MFRLFYLLIILVFITACGSGSISMTPGSDDKTAAGDTKSLSAVGIKEKILASVANASSDSYKAGEVIVKFKSGIVQSQSTNVHKSMGAQVLRKLSGIENTEVVSVPEGMSVIDAVRLYMENPDVEYAEPNYRIYLSAKPNDTYFSQQWALHNEGNTMNSVTDADIDAPEAWDIWTGSRDIIVAVIDTGVDYGHPDLAQNMWINTGETQNDGIDNDSNGRIDDFRGWDFGDSDNDPIDNHGHGTHVAGIIGAQGNNGMGVIGVNWQVRIMPVKIFSRDPLAQTLTAYVTAAVDGINYAVTKGARVINASWHIDKSVGYSQTLYNAISNANTNGVLFIVAAGNGGDDGLGDNNDLLPVYPANYDLPNIITVAASDQDDKLTTFSNYGPTTVEVVAPGNHTLSTMAREYYTTGYETWEGTSMAAPHVAGLAALLMTYTEYVQLGYTIYQFRAMIETYVDQKSQFAGYVITGGRINAYRSLSSMLKPDGMLATSTKPQEVILAWNRRSTGAGELIIERMRVSVDTTFQQLVRISGDATTYTDMTVTGGNTYKYRIRAYKNFGSLSYLPTAQREVYSLYSDVEGVSVTTPLTEPTPSGGGDSGGCSIGARQNAPTAVADLAVMLMPLLIIAIMRRRR